MNKKSTARCAFVYVCYNFILVRFISFHSPPLPKAEGKNFRLFRPNFWGVSKIGEMSRSDRGAGVGLKSQNYFTKFFCIVMKFIFDVVV